MSEWVIDWAVFSPLDLQYVITISETDLSRQSVALALTTKFKTSKRKYTRRHKNLSWSKGTGRDLDKIQKKTKPGLKPKTMGLVHLQELLV